MLLLKMNEDIVEVHVKATLQGMGGGGVKNSSYNPQIKGKFLITIETTLRIYILDKAGYAYTCIYRYTGTLT